MAHPIRPDYSQDFLFSHRLEEFIPPEPPVGCIRAFVDAWALEKPGFQEEMEGSGRAKANLLLKMGL